MAAVDHLSDVMTKLRNGSRAKHPSVDVPASRFIQQFLTILKQEGFIRTLKPVGQPPHQTIRVYLKYLPDRTPAIAQIRRASKPGQRCYRGAKELPRVLSGLGRAILTTSKGLMSDQEAYRQRIGGEVLCHVW